MHIRFRLKIAAVLCLLFSAAYAQQQTAPASTETRLASDRGHFVVSYESRLDPVVINRIHSWVIHLETASGEPITDAEVSLVGGMPVHDHGFPTLPQVTRHLGDGDYLVEGMKFHMNGWWQITVTVVQAELRDDVTFDLVL
jgi:hypothetical protein